MRARYRMPAFIQGLPQTAAAVAYAERVHEGQLRAVDGAPFILHPLEVASLLYYSGAPDHLVAAGVLHDTIEKTDAVASELHRRFGARVAALVASVSEDGRISDFAMRKHALRDQVAQAGHDALLLFVADKVSKVRELRSEALARPASRVATRTPVSRAQRMSHYRACLRLAERLLPGEPLVARLREELETSSGRALAAAVTR